jgi:hypothetical protein
MTLMIIAYFMGFKIVSDFNDFFASGKPEIFTFKESTFFKKTEL